MSINPIGQSFLEVFKPVTLDLYNHFKEADRCLAERARDLHTRLENGETIQKEDVLAEALPKLPEGELWDRVWGLMVQAYV